MCACVYMFIDVCLREREIETNKALELMGVHAFVHAFEYNFSLIHYSVS